MLLTETSYLPGMSLPRHSHESDHLAILVEGSYLERLGSRSYLYVPGDAVHYSRDVQHTNVFGRLRGRCVNIEFPAGRAPASSSSSRTCVPAEIQQLLAHEGHLRNGRDQTWLANARSVIDSQPWTSLTPLADRLAVHPSHLATSFRRAFGISVGQYCRLQRVRLAAKLLIETDAKVAEIAYDAGFFDQSHFSNDFAHITGFTPAALRRVAHS